MKLKVVVKLKLQYEKLWITLFWLGDKMDPNTFNCMFYRIILVGKLLGNFEYNSVRRDDALSKHPLL